MVWEEGTLVTVGGGVVGGAVFGWVVGSTGG